MTKRPTTAEQLITDIENMKVKGAYLITRVSLQALMLRAAGNFESDEQLLTTLTATARRLKEAQPSMASVANACEFALSVLTPHNNRYIPADHAVDLLARRSQEFLAHFGQAQDKVIEMGARMVEDDDQIIIHSYSGTLLAIFQRAREAGRQFEIIATESRPYGEGRTMVTELLKLSIPCTISIDAAMASTVHRANKALVGADSFLANGNVVNKIGTHLLGLVCQSHNVPLYAAGNILKLSHESVRGGKIKMLVRSDDGGIAPEDVRGNPALHVENQIFEETSARYFEALITDQGLIPSSAIAQFTHNPFLSPE